MFCSGCLSKFRITSRPTSNLQWNWSFVIANLVDLEVPVCLHYRMDPPGRNLCAKWVRFMGPLQALSNFCCYLCVKGCPNGLGSGNMKFGGMHFQLTDADSLQPPWCVVNAKFIVFLLMEDYRKQVLLKKRSFQIVNVIHILKIRHILPDWAIQGVA